MTTRASAANTSTTSTTSTTTKGGGLPTAARYEQLNAFGDEPGAANIGPATRATDPATSHAAAVRAARGLSVKQLAVLRVFQLRRDTTPEPITYDALRNMLERYRSLSTACHWFPTLTDSSVRTRAKELRDLGYVDHVDDKGETATGGKCGRFRVSPRGYAIDVDVERFKRAGTTGRGSR